ncbi:MAG: hypothetical protein JSR83_08740 [Proteobacteria bacterium]|nr:hypothetical protein [Pseudomonadota bacterium]
MTKRPGGVAQRFFLPKNRFFRQKKSSGGPTEAFIHDMPRVAHSDG